LSESVNGLKTEYIYVNIMTSGVVVVTADDTLLAEGGLSHYQDGKLTQKCIQKHSFLRKQLVDISL